MTDNTPQTPNPLVAWFGPKRFAFMLGLLVAASHPMVLAGLKSFAYLDFGQYGYPAAVFQREAFARGELPFWNPLNCCGLPFLAQWNVLALYPPALFYLIFPLPWSLSVFCVLHLFLGGFGAYSLAARWTENRLAAAVAGTVYAFNGFTWYALIWPPITAAMAWAPWVVLANERAWNEGGKALAAGVLASALQLLSGGAEVILLTWILLAGLFAVRLSGAECRVRMCLRAGAAWLLAVGLASPQLLPFLELLNQSQRSGNYGSAALGVMPVGGWANYLVPLFHTLRNPQGLHVPPNHWVGSYYLGIAVIYFAAIAVVQVRRPWVWVLSGLTLFSVLMAMGGAGPLYGLVTAVVPVLGFLRFPVKFVILATIALPFLAAYGLAWWTAATVDGQGLPKRTLSRIGIAIVILMALVIWWARAYPLTPLDPQATLVSALTRLVFLALTLGLLIFMGRGSILPRNRRALLGVGLVACFWLDLRTHNADQSPTVSPAVLQQNAVRDFFKWDKSLSAGHSRLMQSPASYERMLAVGYTDLEVDTQGRRLGQFFNFNLLDGVPKVDGLYPLYPAAYSGVFGGLYSGTNQAEALRDFLSVSTITHATNIVGWVTRPGFMPLVTAGQAVIFTNSEAALSAIMRDDFNPRSTVYLPVEAQSSVSATPVPDARAALAEFTSQRLRIQVETPSPAVVVISQSYYPLWQASVNGRRTTLWRANHGFQAVAVPAGSSQVLLEYHERGFYWGLGIAAVAAALTWVGCKKELRENRQKHKST